MILRKGISNWQNNFMWTNKILIKWNSWNWKLFLSRDWSKKICSKKLNKYVTAFDCIETVLIVLSATSSGVWVISFTRIVGAPVGIASASLTLIFSLTTGIIKKLLNITRTKKKTW